MSASFAARMHVGPSAVSDRGVLRRPRFGNAIRLRDVQRAAWAKAVDDRGQRQRRRLRLD